MTLSTLRQDDRRHEQSRQQVRVPTVGCIVHYTLKSGHVRPAIVVHCWDGNPNVSYPPGVVQLQVFVDGSNDGESRYGDDSGIFP